MNTNVTPLIGRHTRIIREVAEAHRVRVEDIMGPRRFRAYNLARREAMQRIRFELGFSFPRIGQLFNRDHTAVLYACRGGRPTNPEKGAAMAELVETELTQKLDTAVSDYQRHFGRPRTIAKLEQMLGSRKEAQRVLDAAIEQAGAPVRRAAE